MKIIDCKQIENQGFIETNLHGSESRFYIKGDICYKKFKSKTDVEYLKDKERKIEFLLDMKDLKDAVLPLSKGYNFEEKVIDGYFMNYYPGSINMKALSSFSNVKELRKFFMAVNLSSLALKRIHERKENIIVGDASYDNLIVLENPLGFIEKVLCIDFDSVQIECIDCKYKLTSELLSQYFAYFNQKTYEHDKNTDRLTRLLYFLNSFFALDIKELPLYEYDKKCELSNTLKNLRHLFIELKNLEDISKLPSIPYMFEVLDLTDVYGLSLKL